MERTIKRTGLLAAAVLALTTLQIIAATGEHILGVEVGQNETSICFEQIDGLPRAEVEFDGHLFQGVAIRNVLFLAGIDVARVESVRIIASDGYRRTYDRELIRECDTLLAFSSDGTPLRNEDPQEILRSIYPDGPAKMMVRMVIQLDVEVGSWRLTVISPDGARTEEVNLDSLKALLPDMSEGSQVIPLSAFLEQVAQLVTEETGTHAVLVSSNGAAFEFQPTSSENVNVVVYADFTHTLPERMGVAAVVDHEGNTLLPFLESVAFEKE